MSEEIDKRPVAVIVHQHVAALKRCVSCKEEAPPIFEVQLGEGRFPSWFDWCRPCIETYATRAGSEVQFSVIGGGKSVRVAEARRIWETAPPATIESSCEGNIHGIPSRCRDGQKCAVPKRGG